MIAYDLECENGHVFEGWFDDAGDYSRQKKKNLLVCPVCDSAAVSRRPSAFSVRSATNLPKDVAQQQQMVAEMGRKISEYVADNFDDVGTDFSKEALKMHYGVAEPRNIRGVSTQAEEDTLKEEGVHFFKIPVQKRTEPETDA
jgi:hypothetical protein